MESARETPSGASEQGTLFSAPEEAAIAKPGVESGAAAAGESDISAEPATKAEKKAASATDELAGELEGMRLDLRSLWLRLLPDDQKHVVEYLDVVTLCRTDSAMTGMKERKDWQKALKGLESVAMNKWPRYSNTNNFAGLRWGVQKHINLKSFKIEKVVLPDGTIASRKQQFGYICELGYPDIATLMVKSKSIGVNNKGYQGGTPTYWAACYGLEKVVRALVTAGADLNKENDDGATPLSIASQQGHLPVVQYLVTAGAHINQAANEGYTPLYVASQEGHLPVVQCLVTAGAHINQANDKGSTPLIVAYLEGHTEIARFLEEAGVTLPEQNVKSE